MKVSRTQPGEGYAVDGGEASKVGERGEMGVGNEVGGCIGPSSLRKWINPVNFEE